MITESFFWKRDLLRSAEQLRRRVAQQRWHDATFAHVERTVMVGFFALRKLIESKKIDDLVANQSVKIVSYPPTGKRVTRMNWFHWWELYDLTKPKRGSVRLPFLCNQFVHSYVYAPEFSESRDFVGLLVSSDRERHAALFSVTIEQVIKIFQDAGQNYPNEVRMVYNELRQDYDVFSKTAGKPHRSHN